MKHNEFCQEQLNELYSHYDACIDNYISAHGNNDRDGVAYWLGQAMDTWDKIQSIENPRKERVT